MVEAPKVPNVYCPKEGRDVPFWWCLGSYFQGKETCKDLGVATVNFPEDFADVKCGPRYVYNLYKGGVDNQAF